MDITHRMFAFGVGVILLVVAGLSLLFRLPAPSGYPSDSGLAFSLEHQVSGK